MTINLDDKFVFLTSSRFWAIIVAAVSIYLQTKGWIGNPEMVLISTVMGGFVTVRTVDRIGDKRVEAAQITANPTTTDTVPNVNYSANTSVPTTTVTTN